MTGADKYVVEYWASNVLQTSYTVAGNAMSLPLNGLAANMTHYFRVGASNAMGTSFTDWTSTYTGTPPAPTLYGRKGYSDSVETVVSLTCNDVPGETQYELYQYVTNQWLRIAILPSNRTSQYLELRTNSRGGWFALKAVNSFGSSWTNMVSVTFLALGSEKSLSATKRLFCH